MSEQADAPISAPSEIDWFGRFLQDSRDTITVVDDLAQLSGSAFIAADGGSYSVLAPRLAESGVGPRLVEQRFLPLALSKDVAVRRIIVVDTEDEEAARQRIRKALREAKFPQSILDTLEIVTFFADVLPAMIAHRPAETLTFADPRPPPRYYAIVSTPRAGSTFLGDLLHSIGLGNPIEHMRPWLINLFARRPAGLFDAVRFVQRLVAFDRSGPIFSTKLISHMIADLQQTLNSSELSYVRELAAGATIIYLNRRDKLAQAISSLRARKTGIWHSTDPAYRAADHYNAFEYDFDEIANTLSYYVNGERQLAASLIHHPNLFVVDYDELSAAPERLCRQIAERLQMPMHKPPIAKVEKLADSASAALAQRFLAEAEERGVAVTQFLDAEHLLQEARQAAFEREAEADRIRQGHARHRDGPYQDRHYHLIDYDCGSVPGVPDLCRGPLPESLEPGRYVLFLGAAQTYGAFAARPFATQVGERLNLDILNLGKGGISPLFFADSPRYRELIAGARAVVVQAMAARMVPTSRFASLGNMNLMYLRDDPQRTTMDSAMMWERMRTTEPEEILLSLVAEARAAWADAMKAIAQCATGPTVLLWFSERTPDYDIRFDSHFAMFHRFPQLVDAASVDAVKPYYSAYVEAISPPGGSEPTRSAFSGVVLPVIFGGGRLDEQYLQTVNHYYPTQPMHDRAADALAPILERLVSGAPP